MKKDNFEINNKNNSILYKIKSCVAFICIMYIIISVGINPLFVENVYISYIVTIFTFAYLVYFYLDLSNISKKENNSTYQKQIEALQTENKFIYSLMNDNQKKQIYLRNQELYNQYLNDFHTKIIKEHKK